MSFPDRSILGQLIALTEKKRTQWGNWHLKKSNWTLVYRHDGSTFYEIDLEGISTCGAMLDWIFQLAGNKTWMSTEDSADLIDAFRDIFHPQRNLCSFGSNNRIDAPRFLRERYPL